ncbi:MAG: type II CRISPR-associated endonuclease Cas1 [Bacteroidales bacterium]|nr:type II CRISPR-associated endonuclease Cas1 [Bacteroidales bacterium]
MLKRTLFFSNPCSLSVKNKQLVIKQDDKDSTSVPIEDVGLAVFEHQQIKISMPLLDELADNNVAVLFCDRRHMPHSMLFPLEGNHLQAEVYRKQAMASEPLKKQLWKQTVEAKIHNQASLLKKLCLPYEDLLLMKQNVKSGDSTGREGYAARIYWSRLFGNDFTRDRNGMPPNNMLNYGYIILRAAVARAITGSGLFPTFGIHHHNRYNAFCLADDIMEPYRPFVDATVYYLNEMYPGELDLNKEIKAGLLKTLTVDVYFRKSSRPLMVGLSQTTASLAKCFYGDKRTIDYPFLN